MSAQRSKHLSSDRLDTYSPPRAAAGSNTGNIVPTISAYSRSETPGGITISLASLGLNTALWPPMYDKALQAPVRAARPAPRIRSPEQENVEELDGIFSGGNTAPSRLYLDNEGRMNLHRSQSTAVLNSQVPLKGPNISVGEMKRINNGQNHGSGRQRSKSEGLLARRCVDLSSGQYPSLSLNRPIAGGNFLDTSLTQRPDKTLRLQKSWEYQASFDAIWPVTDPVTLTFLAMQVAKALYISSPFLKQTGANNPSPHYNNPMSPLQSLPANFPLSTPRPDHTFLSQSLPATIINKPSLSSKESIPTPGPFPGPEMPTLAVDAPLTRRGSTGEGFESSPNWNDGEGRINLERFEYGAENTHSAVSRSIINAERVDIEKHATFSQPLTPSNSSSRTSSIMEFDSLDRLDTPFEVHLDYLAISTSPSGDAFDALPPSSPRPSNSYLESHDIPKSPRQLQQSRPRLSFTFPFFVPSKRTLPCHIGNDSRMQPEAQKVRHSSIRASRDSARIVNTGIASNRDQNLKVESG